ncbi:MFS transporter [Haloglycomyces albus]|uniref:MFS transporter n=1 Tax=Haloglycomyces albus TaxID=526067 RepID=UPI00046D253C|nr:MFS transporter [Haloglycomyces albus]
MTTTATTTTPAVSTGQKQDSWLAVISVAMGVFTLVTSEILPVGLLTPIADGLSVAEGTAGLMVATPGLMAAVSAPILTVATAKADRRKVLMVLSLLVVIANVVSAISESFTTVLAARVLVGIATGGFWSIAGGIALRIAPHGKVSKAVALVYGGGGAATVAGVPLVTIVGDAVSWRASFLVVAGLAALTFVFLLIFVPALPSQGSVRVGQLTDLLRSNRGVQVGAMLTVLFVAGHFTAYTYVRPVLQSGGISAAEISLLLVVFGIAGLTGNALAAVLLEKHLTGTLIGIAALMGAATAGMAVVPLSLVSAALLMLMWGLAFGLLAPSVQSWYLRAAPDAAELSTAINTFFFNLSIAVASFVGGLLVDEIAVTAVLWAGSALAVTAAAAAWFGSARVAVAD